MEFKSKFMQDIKGQSVNSAPKVIQQENKKEFKSSFMQQVEAERSGAPTVVTQAVKQGTAVQQPQVQQPAQTQTYGLNPVEEFLKNQPQSGMVNYSEEHTTNIAGEYVTRLEQKMLAAETELQGVQIREQALVKRSEELKTAYANAEALREKYELTGDEVAGQAYLIAVERYNEQVEQHNKNLEKLQKDQKVYDKYNEAVYQYRKGKALYDNRVAQQEERARQEAEYMEQHPAEALADASLEEVEAKLEEMEDLLASRRMDYEAAKDTTKFDASGRKEMNRAEMNLKELRNSISETYDKVQDLRQLLKEKKNRQGAGKIWNSSAGGFVDRVDYAMKAGVHSGFGGLNAVTDAVGNAIEWTIGATIGDIANLTGSEELKKKSDAWINASKKYEGAEEWQAAADAYMQDALVRAGKVDGWIAQQVQNIGSMMVDMYTVGMGAVASAGTSLTLPGNISTGKVMALRAGGSSAMEAAKKGYSMPEQIMVGVATGALEYISEKMFGGNPIYDTDKGWVTKGVEKLFGTNKITKLMYSKGFELFSEGLEEVFVELTQPVAEGILTATEIDFASGEDLLNAFAGGVFLSLAGGGAQVVANATADVVTGTAKAKRTAVNAIRNAGAVQDLVNEGLAADPESEAYIMAQKLQKKLDAGKRLSATEIGKQLFANQEAIDAGDLTDAPMEENENAPEGVLQKPEDGFYAIRTVTGEDGKTTYQLVQVHSDGSIETIAEPTADLLAAKVAAEAKGMQVEQIGTVEALRRSAEEAGNEAAEENKTTVAENATAAEPEEISENVYKETNRYEEPAPMQPEAGGIRWAGNEYEEGVKNNGTEQQAKPESRRVGQNADQGRPAGRAGGSAGTNARKGRAADIVRRSGDANRIKSAAAAAKLERRSLKELGLPSGADGKTLRVIPKGLDPAVDRAIEIVENAGLRCVPVSGSMFVNTKNGEQRMLGIYYNGTVYLQADSVEAAAEETAKHEVFHNRAKQNKTLVKRLEKYVRANYTWDEIRSRFNKYYLQYRDTYTYKNEDQLQEMIWEEFLADVYAEYSRYGDPELEGLSEVVQEEAWRKNVEQGEASEKGTRYSEANNSPWFNDYAISGALYEAFDHADSRNDNLIRVSEMPQYIVNKFGINGDIYIYRNHAYENMVSREQAVLDGRPVTRNGEDIHFHNFGVEKMTAAIKSINDPTMAIATKSKDGNPTVIMILPEFGTNGAPLYAVLGFYSNKSVNGNFEKKPHIVLTIAERDYVGMGGRVGYLELIQNAIKNGRILDYKKERGNDLSVIANPAGVGDITESFLNANVSQFKKEIKQFKEKNNIFYSAASEDKAGQRAEKNIAAGIGRIMSMPKSAERKLQTGLIRELLAGYQQTGEIDADMLSDAVSTAFAEGLVADNEYYETYRHVKDFLRTSPITISEQDQADIADFTQFKKRAFGTLRITKEGGTPVDVMYQQVQEMAPGLLTPEKTHPADQLMQLYEKAREIRRVEIPLERAMGEQADQFYEWAEGQILKLLEKELTKYADSVTYNTPKPEKKTEAREYPEYVPDDYDFRAHDRMYNYGQQDFYEKPQPGSGVLQDDYIQPEGGGLEWAGQMRAGNWLMDQERRRDEGRFDERAVETEDEEGQFVVDEFVPEPVAEEELTEEERARRGTMREWIQYVMREGQLPEEFAERMRNSARGELKGGAKILVERMEKTARQRNGDGVNLFRDPEMTDEEYAKLNAAWKAHQERKAEQGETQKDPIVRKKDFRSTPAMEKLGIKIDGSVTRYRETQMLRGYEEAAYQARQRLNKRLEKMNASKQEIDLANMLVDGTLDVNVLDSHRISIPRIAEIADYIMAKRSFDDNLVYRRKAEINQANDEIAREVFADKASYMPKLPGRLEPFTKTIMNNRTPERVAKQIFGAEQGSKIYEIYFRPVWVNGAEMYRFKNRMLKKAQGFTDESDTEGGFFDQNGKRRALTEREWEFAQRLLEAKAVAEEMEKLKENDRSRIAEAARALNAGVSLEEVSEVNKLEEGYEQGLAQAYADYLYTNELADKMDRTIMENAIKVYQQIYNDFYEAYNDFLVSHGQPEIGFIKNYAPHFQKAEVQMGLAAAIRSLGTGSERVMELPTEIAGRTADFKPNKKWNPHAQTRKGKQTDYHLLLGFQHYLDYAAEVFYHMDDVMRIRSAVKFFRGQYSSEGISAAIQDAFADMYKSVEWKEKHLKRVGKLDAAIPSYPERDVDAKYVEYVDELFENADPKNLTKYAELTTWLDNYANIVAGKQSAGDRGQEADANRSLLNLGPKLAQTFAKANVAGNLSSVLNQSAQLPLLRATLGKGYLMQAAKDMKNGTIAKENFADLSDFLTDKRGVERITTDNREKRISWLYKPAEMADRIMSTLAVRGRYLKALDEGNTPEEALRIADDYARRVMGSRMRGAKPVGFENKRFFAKLVHTFQLEPANTLDYMVSDLPEAVKYVYKTQGKKAGNRYLAAVASTLLVATYVLNSIMDELYGGSPAPYDLIGWLLNFVAGGWGVDDDEFLKIFIDNGTEKMFGKRLFDTERPGKPTAMQWAGAFADMAYDIGGDIPFLRNVLGVAGVGDQSMPTIGINKAGKALSHGVSTLFNQMVKGEEETGLTWAGAAGEIIMDAAEIGAQFVGGGRQLQKTLQGIEAVVRGGKYSGYGENARLLYPIDRNVGDFLRAPLFGLSALDETDKYYAGGKALTAAQTQNAKALEKQGVDIEDTYALYQEFSEINSELGKEKITSAEARIEKRDAIAAMDLDDRQKLEVYLETMGGENEETRIKYMSLLTAGVSWQQLTDLDNAYNALGEDADGDGEPDLDSVERGTAKRNAIATMDLSDYQKLEVYDRYHLDRDAKNYETTRAEFEAMLDAGLSWDEITEAHNTYAWLNADEEVNATQKATEYAKWADQQGWSDAQKNAVKDRYTFWQMIPAEASSYEKFTGAGLEPEAADYVVSVLSDLTPEDGKEVVTDVQRIEAVAESELEENDASAAIRQMLSEKQAATYDDLISQGLTTKQYAQYRRAVYGLTSDKDKNGNTISGSKKKKVLSAINGLKISSKLKDALYYAYGYTESTLKDAPWH